MPHVNQPTVAPTRKVGAGLAIGIPGAVIIAWVAKQAGVEMSPEVAAAFGGLITQIVSYFTRERAT